jgi:hypothetical protein
MKRTSVRHITVRDPIVDRLAYILPWGLNPLRDQQKLIATIRRRVTHEIEQGNCTRAYLQGGRYRENFRIGLPGMSDALVQIGALQPDRQNGGIRVVINPARFADGDVDYLHEVMERIVGQSYRALLRRPLLNNVDFAVDIENAKLDRLLVSYSNAHRATVFGKRIDLKGHIETYNFGSVTSAYMCAAYDKRQERINAAILELAKSGARAGAESLKQNCIKQLHDAIGARDIVRIEIRGKKMRGIPLWKVATLPNRFARFSFADRDVAGTELPEIIEASFHALCQQRGVKAALAAFKHTEWARQVPAYWRSRQAAWWKPNALWQDAYDALYRVGLFPDEAFEETE